MKTGKFYKTSISESHRPDLQPNGRIVKCIEDKQNGYLVIQSSDKTEPNTWLIHQTNLKDIN